MAEDEKENKDHKEETPQSGDSNASNQSTDVHLAQSGSGQNHERDKDSDANDPDKAEIDHGLSAVAESPKKSIITMIIVVLLVGGLAYYFFFSGSDSNESSTSSPTNISLPTDTSNSDGDVPIPSIPSAPVAPSAPPSPPSAPTSQSETDKPSAPQPPKPAEPQPPTPNAPSVQNQALLNQDQEGKYKSQQEAQQREKQRITANIMVKQGGDSDDKSKAKLSQDALAASGTFVPQQTSSTQQQITKVGNLSNIITQGKIIDAVLESSIISNYPGPVRALVTQDVYSDKGENVLIPKGSRLIGTFSSGYQAGQNRVMINWSRLIMPNGYDVAVGSPSAGPGGLLGVEGEAHTEFGATLANALLLSTINISFARVAEKLTNNSGNTSTTVTNNSNGQTTTSSTSPSKQAVEQATQNLGNTMQSYVQENFIVKPYVSIAHGTRVKVFVNKDLLFPGNSAGGVNIIQ